MPALGIDCVRVYAFEEALAEFKRSPGTAAFVVKPPWDAGAARGVCYVRESAALHEAVERCSRMYGGSLIEDYIPGGADAMRTVLLLFTSASEVAATFTMQKIRHWPQTGGSTAAGHQHRRHRAWLKRFCRSSAAQLGTGRPRWRLKLDPRRSLQGD